MLEDLNIEQIKAELYDLRGHNCNGRLTLNPDGSRDPGDKPCDGCARSIVLHNQLYKLMKV